MWGEDSDNLSHNNYLAIALTKPLVSGIDSFTTAVTVLVTVAGRIVSHSKYFTLFTSSLVSMITA